MLYDPLEKESAKCNQRTPQAVVSGYITALYITALYRWQRWCGCE